MKNYVQLWIVVVVDTSVPAFVTYASLESAQQAADYASLWTSPNQATTTMYYFKLNKALVCNPLVQSWLNANIPIDMATGQLQPSPDFYTEDPPDDWNVEDPLWKTDPNDPASVKATKIAEETIALNEKSKSSQSLIFSISLTFSQELLNAAVELSRGGFANLSEIVRILLNDYLAGRISEADAVIRWLKILESIDRVLG
jgi:hypothetical protein